MKIYAIIVSPNPHILKMEKIDIFYLVAIVI